MVTPRLNDQIVIITGAGRGIGRAIADRFASEGATLALLDVNTKDVAKAANELTERGCRALAVEADVSKREDVVRAVAKVQDNLGSPSILINNAGVSIKGGLLDLSDENWQRVIGVNLSSVFYCSQVVAPYLIARGYGRIVNISSIAGRAMYGNRDTWAANSPAYSASKAGVLGLTRSLAVALAQYGVTVNAICPGSANTPMMRQIDKELAQERGVNPSIVHRARTNFIPNGRYAETAEIASLVVYLASSDAGHITGQSINIDGGTVMF